VRRAVELATVWRADREIAKQGAVRKIAVMEGRGKNRRRIGWRTQKNRWIGIRESSTKAFRIFASAFGLCGPSSRVGLEVTQSTPTTADEELRALLESPPVTREPIPEFEEQKRLKAEAAKLEAGSNLEKNDKPN
jgi:hypothetical protein